MSSIPTVTIKCPANERTGLAVINASEYVPTEHELADGEIAPDSQVEAEGSVAEEPVVIDERLANLSAEQVEAALAFLAEAERGAQADDVTPDADADADADTDAGDGDGGDGAGDDQVIDEAEAKSKARAEYLQVVGKQPGPKWDAETILTKLEAHRAKVAAAAGEQ